jgi:hypothetical protein
MSPRALLALLSLFVSSSAVAVARPEATPVGTTSGPTPSGDAVRRADEDAVVLLSSMTVTAVEEEDPGPAHGGEDASEDASRSWYVRCHALASPGETRLAGTLPVMTHHAARRAVVPLGFALGTVSPGNTEKEVLACALFDLLPGVSRARVSRALLPLARFADAGDGAAAVSFSFPNRGSRARELGVALELRCDACVGAAEGTPARRDETSGAARDGARVAARVTKKKNEKRVSEKWRDAFFAATGILAAETCALAFLAAKSGVSRRDARAEGQTGRLRVKRKTSDAPGGGGPAVRFGAFSLFFSGKTERERARREARRLHSRNGFEAFV